MAKDDGIPIRSNKSRKRDDDDDVPIRTKKSNSKTFLILGIAGLDHRPLQLLPPTSDLDRRYGFRRKQEAADDPRDGSGHRRPPVDAGRTDLEFDGCGPDPLTVATTTAIMVESENAALELRNGTTMSRKLLIFLLSELKVLRFICRNAGCGVTCEVPVGQVGKVFGDPTCKGCGKRFYPVTSARINPLIALAQAIQDMQNPVVTEGLDVEFVMPDATPNQ
jgi:hypothetical protein